MVNPFTPSYEKNFLAEHSRGHLFDRLAEVVTFLEA
jgi:hypothetical protein